MLQLRFQSFPRFPLVCRALVVASVNGSAQTFTMNESFLRTMIQRDTIQPTFRGNRTASHQGSSYTYQSFNRLTAANGSSFSYDANGNLISKTDASGSWTYSWDYENRLKQASKSGGVTVTYSYDALGRRVQRTSSTGGTTKLIRLGQAA